MDPGYDGGLQFLNIHQATGTITLLSYRTDFQPQDKLHRM